MTVIEIDENGAEVGKARFLTDEDQLLEGAFKISFPQLTTSRYSKLK